MSRLPQAAVALAAALLLGAGLALAAASLLPPDLVRSRLDGFALDQSADLVAGGALAAIAVRARIAGAALLAAGSALILGRRAAAAFLLRLAADARTLASGVRARFRAHDRWALWALLAITAAAAALRAGYLWLPMRYDESYTLLRYASKPLLLALANYSAPNNHLFHTLLVHLSTAVFGGAPWAVRLPAYLAGVLMIPAAYLLAARLFGRTAALFTAALVASASALVEYSANARGYTLIGLITCLLWWLAAYLRDHGNTAAWALFAVLAALGFHTMPVMLYPFGAAAAWLLLLALLGDTALGRAGLLRRLAAACAGAAALTVLLYLPALVASGAAALVGNPFVAAQTGGGYLHELLASLALVAEQWRRDLPLAVQAVLAAGLLTTLAASLRPRAPAARRAGLALAAIVLWCAAALLVQRVVPYRRVWLWLLPLALAFAAAGVGVWLDALLRRLRVTRAALLPGLALALALLLGANVVRLQSVCYSNETETLRDAPAITAHLKERLQPGDRVFVVAPSDTILEYYFRRQSVPVDYLLTDAATAQRMFVVVNRVAGGAGQSLEELLAQAGRPAAPVGPPLEFRFAALYEVAP